MSFYIQITFLFVCAAFGIVLGDGRFATGDSPSLDFLLRAWVRPESSDLLIMAGLGISSALGGYLISQAYRITQAVVIAPIEYIALPLSIFWGVLIWKEWPDFVAWLGIALILSSGLIIFWREVVLGKKIATVQPLRKPR